MKNETNELITYDSLQIYESSEFVQLPNCLNEKQLQLLLLLVSQIKPTDKNYRWVAVPYDTLIEMYNKNTYDKKSIEAMKKMIKNLSKQEWNIIIEHKDYFGHYVEKGVFDDKERIVKLKLSNETIYFFLQFDHGLYTRYGIIRKLHTKSALQLYRWCYLKSNFNNAISIKTEEAIKLFYDNEKVIKTNDFIRKHLDPAVQKINELTDINVKYEKIYSKKDKRKISSLKFYISKNNNHDDDYIVCDDVVVIENQEEIPNYNMFM